MMFAVLGNTPELSALELGVPYTSGQVAVLKQPVDITKLGGTIKIAAAIGQFEDIPQLLRKIPTDHKLVFGFSVYAGDDTITDAMIERKAKALELIGLQWKKELKAAGRSVRFVVSKEPQLSSVIVTKEHLLRDQTDFVVALYADHQLVGRTIVVQDFKKFSEQDFGRPQRDAFSGMLPPKVARMMLNIAQPKPNEQILDPFCGSGTVIHEALQLGFTRVTGSDISAKCIADTTDNINWLLEQSPEINTDDLNLYQQDVLKLTDTLTPGSIDVIVAEGYLGPVQLSRLESVFTDLNDFYQQVFPILAKLLKPGGRIVLALPTWKQGEELLELAVESSIAQSGLTPFHTPIYYGRKAARVVRKIYFLQSLKGV